MDTFFQALVMAFREGLEGFLIIVILLKFLEKSGNRNFKKQVWFGAYSGIAFSIVFGLILLGISNYIGGLSTTAKIWESLAGFVAVILVSSFIIWMIKNGNKIKEIIETEAANNLTKKGIFLLVLFMVAREGTEIAIFSFAGKYEILPVILGLLLSMVLVFLISFALIKVNLKMLFIITLGYLIIQAGYLLGYSIHEGLSAAKNLGWLDGDNPLFLKAYNLSDTILNHKKGLIGLPLNVTIGWYSKPEWIQLLIQYSFTFLLFGYWQKKRNNEI